MMRYTWAALLAVPLLMHFGGAEAQNSRASVLIELHGDAVASTTRCSLLSFVAAPPLSQPDVNESLCAIGGPFGAGMVGLVTTGFNFGRGTLQFDDTIAFSPTDVLTIHNVMLNTDTVVAGPPGSDQTTTGGVQYFTGTWSITGEPVCSRV